MCRGVQDVQLSTRVPVVFGVLTVNTLDQALERSAKDESNKVVRQRHRSRNGVGLRQDRWFVAAMKGR